METTIKLNHPVLRDVLAALSLETKRRMYLDLFKVEDEQITDVQAELLFLISMDSDFQKLINDHCKKTTKYTKGD